MRISRLDIESVKRIRVVEITPDGTLVKIRGNNGQGKSSVLDAIAYALGGADLCPAEPIRRGEKRAKVRVELDDGMVAERAWTPSGTRLEVWSADGTRQARPQAVLDRIVGKLSFDPMAFMRLRPREQAQTLRTLCGVDTTELDNLRRYRFDSRTEWGREAIRLRALLESSPEVEAPAEPISILDLLMEQQDRSNRAKELDNAERSLEKLRAKREGLDGKLQRTRRGIVELQEMLAEAEADLVRQVAEAEALDRDITARTAALELEAATPLDLEELPARLREVEAINERVRSNASRRALASDLAEVEESIGKLTDEIEEVDLQKAAMLASAPFPVPGLGFDDSGVTFRGIPLGQASSAEQLRVSLGMGMALNPHLRVIFVRDGSLLDEQSMSLIADMAVEADAQVWCEVVGKSGDGIVIEDGMVEAAVWGEADYDALGR